MSKISLSFKKFTEILNKHKYVVSRIYTLNDECKFVELKSPKHFKVFYVRIPSKFEMHIDDSISENNIYSIYQTSEENNLQKEYITMFGDRELVAISSESICYLNGECVFYQYGDLDTESDKDDYVKDLEQEFKNVKAKHSTTDVEFIEEEPPTTTPVEITFEDADGEELEECIEEIITDSPKKIHINKHDVVNLKFEEIENDASSYKSTSSDESRDYDLNSIPQERRNVDVGVIYVCIDIQKFYKVIFEYETTLLEKYNEMDSQEMQLRQDKMNSLDLKLSELKKGMFDRLNEIHQKELELKDQSQRLSSVLVSCEKMISKDKKLDDVAAIEDKTKKALDDINVEKLRLRDLASRMIFNFSQYIDDIKNMLL